jgi:hypothetical protein
MREYLTNKVANCDTTPYNVSVSNNQLNKKEENTMATTTMEDCWLDVYEEVQYAKCIAFDGCHKIYLAMDKTQAEWFEDSYETFTGTPEEMLALLKEWYEGSCMLRFISSVETNEADPNEGFTSLIPQGAEDEDEDEDEGDE